MKTLILVPQIAGGGAEASMARLQSELVRRGLEVQIAAIKPSFAPEKNELSNFILSSARSRVVQIGQAYLSLRKLNRQREFKRIILNCELAEFIGAIALTRRNEIFVVEHTSRPWIGRRVLGFVTRLILAIRGAKWITVVNDRSRIWPFNQLAVYIPNPIEIARVEDSVLGEGVQRELVYVGRLAPSKRPELVVQVAMDLKLPLHIFGDGEMMEQLKQQAEDSEVKFYGFVPNVWSKVSPEWIFVFPSLYEGDGMVVLEAALHGNVVLLSDNEDLRRLRLPEQCYFSDYLDLRNRLSILKSSKSELDFRFTPEEISRITHERSLSIVGEKWKTTLDS